MNNMTDKNCFHCVHGLQTQTCDAWCDVDNLPHKDGCDAVFGNYVFGMAKTLEVEKIIISNKPIKAHKIDTGVTKRPAPVKIAKPKIQSSMF